MEIVDKIRAFGLRLLARREYSEQDFREKLLKKFPENFLIIDEILAEFVTKNWLSNERFCECFIRDQKLKKIGPLKIKQKLYEKGVGEDLFAAKILQNFSIEEQQELINYLETKKLEELKKRRPDDAEFERRQKVRQYLFGRGFYVD
jgi:SOS response regulatory protein OraA/RecX